MSNYQLNEGLYISPTPAGAYYAISGNQENPSRRLLTSLLQLENTPLLNQDGVLEFTMTEDENEAMDLLYHLQMLGWIEGCDEPRTAPAGALEDIVPEYLPSLSSQNKALLADNLGFYISSIGFPHETAEELSALSADIASMHDRHIGLLRNNLGLDTSAWSLIDAAGNSRVGFWPMYISDQRFVLVASGIPHLNHPALTQLIWALSKRYGS